MAAGHRFVVQRHRARRLHYDFRLEVDGVLVSWAVPKGPTLDPEVKRLAVHVEDHPLDYFDFEGVIPEGEYGGGDVIVWDWGTWAPADGDDPARRHRRRATSTSTCTARSCTGRFVLVRARPAGGKEQWLLLHKHDDDAVAGWDAEDHPRSVKSGRTNDEVKAAPDGHVVRAPAELGPAPTTADELAALDALGKAGQWQLGGHDAAPHQPRQGAVPGQDGRTRRHQARPHPVPRHDGAAACCPTWSTGRSTCTASPNGVDKPGFWHKAAPAHAPDWMRAVAQRRRRPRRDRALHRRRLARPRWRGWPTTAPSSSTRGRRTIRDPRRPTWALIDIDPGADSTFDDVLVLARLHRTALEHLGVRGPPEGHRPARHPDLGARRRPATRSTRRGPGSRRCRGPIGSTVPELVSWEWEVGKRGGQARLDYTQNAINKTLVAPFSARPAAGAPVSVPIEWDELDDPDLRPDRWTIADAAERVQRHGDPLAPLIGLHQRLPTL